MLKVINFECFCEQGIRENNEDYLLPHELKQQRRVFVLCDGMGGHGHGEVASQTVCESVYAFLTSQIDCESYEFAEGVMQHALDFAIEELTKVDTFTEDGRRMGTTLVVVLLNKFDILVGHVGDSRCYMFDKDWNIEFCTNDHSEVAEAIRRGFITEEAAFDHPKKNIITRSVQAEKSVEIEVDVLKNVANSYNLLLCTDGVSDTLRNTEIEALLFQPTTLGLLSGIREECVLKSRDNFSAILIQISQDEISLEPFRETSEKVVHNQCEVRKRKLGSYCSYCGTEIVAGTKFCSCCGEQVFQQDHFESVLSKENDEFWDWGLIKIKKPNSIKRKVPKMKWPFGIIAILIVLSSFFFYRTRVLSDKQNRNIALANSKSEEKNNQIRALNATIESFKEMNKALQENIKVLNDSIIKLNAK